MPAHRIIRYDVDLYSSRTTTNVTPSTSMARVLLFDANNVRALASFHADGTSLDPPTVTASGYVYLHFNISQMDTVLEILRQEDPVWVFEFGAGTAGLAVGGEPVGEEEGSKG